MNLTGRKKLITSLLPEELISIGNFSATPLNIETLKKDLEYQLPIHFQNAAECRYLLDYYKGNQPVLERDVGDRTNDVHTVLNFAQAISRNISSYTYSGGVQYVSAEPEYFGAVKAINDAMKREGKAQVQKEVQDYQSICGTAFVSILPDFTKKNDTPFELAFLSPENTFVVYSCYNTGSPVYAGTHYSLRLPDGSTKIVLQIYTAKEAYVFESGIAASAKYDIVRDPVPHSLGNVPIIEYPNNAFRMGDFEAAIPVLNSINDLSSDCLYNIQTVVTSYLALFGVDLEEEDIEAIKKNRILVFRGEAGVNQDAKFIHVQLDGDATESLRNYLENAVKYIVGVPDRDSGTSGSDTGAAAELRTGQGDIEVVAQTKSLYAVRAERQLLDIAIRIMYPDYIPVLVPSSAIDVEITRINRADMLTKTQAMQNLNDMGFEESDIVYFGNITNDVAGVAKRWKDNKSKLEQEQQQEGQQATEEIVVQEGQTV